MYIYYVGLSCVYTMKRQHLLGMPPTFLLVVTPASGTNHCPTFMTSLLPSLMVTMMMTTTTTTTMRVLISLVIFSPHLSHLVIQV